MGTSTSRNRLGVLLLAGASALALTTGCATTAVVRAGSERTTVTDRIETVERAFAAPDGRVLVCVYAARPARGSVRRYTLELPADPQSTTDGAAVVSPRALRKGWPELRCVETQRLRSVPVLHLAGPATAPGVAAVLGRAADTDVVVGFADQSQGALAFCRREPEAPHPTLMVYSLPTRERGPAYFVWVLLPAAVAADASAAAIVAPLAIPAGLALANYIGHIL